MTAQSCTGSQHFSNKPSMSRQPHPSPPLLLLSPRNVQGLCCWSGSWAPAAGRVLRITSVLNHITTTSFLCCSFPSAWDAPAALQLISSHPHPQHPLHGSPGSWKVMSPTQGIWECWPELGFALCASKPDPQVSPSSFTCSVA